MLFGLTFFKNQKHTKSFKTLLNWAKQGKMRVFSRKSSFPKQRTTQKTNRQSIHLFFASWMLGCWPVPSASFQESNWQEVRDLIVCFCPVRSF